MSLYAWMSIFLAAAVEQWHWPPKSFLGRVADGTEIFGESRLEIDHILPLLRVDFDLLGFAIDLDGAQHVPDTNVQVFQQLGKLRRLAGAEPVG